MNRKLTLVVFALLAGTLASAPLALANYGGKGHTKSDGLKDKFFHKAHYLMENAEELGLNDQQVEKIKTLKIETKKQLIRQGAEVEVLALDIKSRLYDRQIDTEAVNQLISQKYDLKKQKAQTIVNAYAELKKTLTDDQYNKMKALKKEMKKEMKSKFHEKWGR